MRARYSNNVGRMVKTHSPSHIIRIIRTLSPRGSAKSPGLGPFLAELPVPSKLDLRLAKGIEQTGNRELTTGCYETVCPLRTGRGPL
jgi:hypothetical protein